MDISVIGLGKLGLCTAACFASAGHTVFGYDTSTYIRKQLSELRCPIDETGLPELLNLAWPNLKVVDCIEEAVELSDVTFIIVPTPSLTDGRFNNEFVREALSQLAPALAAKRDFHIVAVVSTVMPGSSEQEFLPLLESLTSKKCGTDFGLVYNPEFIALGSVIRNFLNPDMVLIGASDSASGASIKSIYEMTCHSSPQFSVMSLVNAEITKLSLNCYVTMKISFANGLAALCERVSGANLDVITEAIGSDTRVGKKCLKGGLGFGGPCFPRDNDAFQVFASEYGEDALLGKSVVKINKSVPERVFNLIVKSLPAPSRIALLGLSYKADTHIIEESQSIIIAKMLQESGYLLNVHDPKAKENAQEVLSGAVNFFDNPEKCASSAEAVVVLTCWPEYRCLDWRKIAGSSRIVFDCWRIVPESDRNKFEYYALGLGK